MKQVLQSLRNGNTLVEDVPCPMVKPGHVLIRTHKTLVSVGTEKMLLDFGKANFIQKARQQPDKVRMVISLGSPIRSPRDHSNATHVYDRVNGTPEEEELERIENLNTPPPVPTTSIYS